VSHVTHRTTVTIAGAIAMLAGDPVHHISIRAVPSMPPNATCVASALTLLGATRRSWCCEQPPRPQGVDLYAIQVQGESVLVDVPIAPGATQPEAELAWSTISTPSDAHVAEVRRVIEAAYNSIRAQCGGLPPLADATQNCSHKGCPR